MTKKKCAEKDSGYHGWKSFGPPGWKSMPGIMGYVGKKDDTLWRIAKRGYITAEQIKQTTWTPANGELYCLCPVCAVNAQTELSSRLNANA